MWRIIQNRLQYCAREESIRGHQLPLYIETFDGLVLEFGFLGL